METQVTTKKETSLKPAQIKQLALDYLLDKRKSVSLFKMGYLHSKVGNQLFCQGNEKAQLVGS